MNGAGADGAWAGDNIPGLKIEPCDDGTVMLEQEWAGNVDRVGIHHTQLRFIAEKLGMLPQVTASDAALMREQQVRIDMLERDRDRLRRTLRCLSVRAEKLHRNICASADMGHEDLTTEVVQATALVDMLELACSDFDEEEVAVPQKVELGATADLFLGGAA